MDISLNVTVHCVDGFGGHSTHVILNPMRQTVSHVVVAEKKAPHRERLVPIAWIKTTTPDLILLDCTRAQLTELDRFVVLECLQMETAEQYSGSYPYPAPPQTYKPKKTVSIEVENIPIAEVAVRQEARVEACDGPIGVLETFQIDPTAGRITHLGLRIGPIWEQRAVIVGAADIQRIEERTIYLRLSRAAVTDLAIVPA